jgi:hypothetical protein
MACQVVKLKASSKFDLGAKDVCDGHANYRRKISVRRKFLAHNDESLTEQLA